MSKRLWVWTGICAACATAIGFVWWLQRMPARDAPFNEKELAEASRRMGNTVPVISKNPTPIALNRPVRVAIGNLGLDAGQESAVADLVVAEGSFRGGIQMVERRELEAVLREQHLSLSGLVRAKDVIHTSKLLKADWFLFGANARFNGTNCLVARIIDAATGITLDAEVVPQQSVPAMAAQLEAFLGRARQNAATGRAPVYLALSTFEDLSLNGRQLEFPQQLREHLVAAFQHTRLVFLEREQAETLLREMELDLAGLTEQIQGEPKLPMQSAFWLVDGSYQSYETTNFQVECTLNVSRIFSTGKQISFRGKPDEALFGQIQQAILHMLDQNSAIVVPTRVSEVRNLMATGKELIQLGGPGMAWVVDRGGNPVDFGSWNPQALHNTKEAIRAFQTALLLEPDNYQAKLYLAACLRNPAIDRLEEARNYYRQIIEDEKAQDKWLIMAQRHLDSSFNRWPFDEAQKAAWFEKAANETTHPKAAEFYNSEARAATLKATLSSGEAKAQALAEERLLANITNSLFGNFYGRSGTEEFVTAFGTNQAAAASRAAELFPKMRSQAPNIEPYLLAACVTVQVDTNAPIVRQFQDFLDQHAEHPERVFRSDQFWWHVSGPICEWSFQHKLYRMAARLMERKIRAAVFNPKQSIETEDKMYLICAYLGMQRWNEAQKILESFSDLPLVMKNAGPWGKAFTVVLTSKWVAYCKQKQGLPVEADPLEFQMEKPSICLCPPALFAADDKGLWLITGSELVQVDFELRTNFVISLPEAAAVSCVCPAPDTLWIGTEDGGMLKFDKTTRTFQLLTVKEGLLMNSIKSLALGEDKLWIGYGETMRGGLGELDLHTGKIRSFSASLLPPGPQANQRPRRGEPSRLPILAVASGVDGAWFLPQQSALQHYNQSQELWEDAGVNLSGSQLASNGERLALGQEWNHYGDWESERAITVEGLGVSILDLREHKWQHVQKVKGLPPGAVTALDLDDGELWVGGLGYVALVDLVQAKVLRFARIAAREVNQIQMAGGYVWAQYDCHLHRALLSKVR